MPSALFFLPFSYALLLTLKIVLKSTLSHTSEVSIYTSYVEQSRSLCCDCKVYIDLEPEPYDMFSCQTQRGHSSVKQRSTDAKGSNELHTKSKHT